MLTNYFFVRHCITRRVGRIGFAPELNQARNRIHPDAFARTVADFAQIICGLDSRAVLFLKSDRISGASFAKQKPIALISANKAGNQNIRFASYRNDKTQIEYGAHLKPHVLSEGVRHPEEGHYRHEKIQVIDQ
ncbi:MAG: hypothetical protein I4O48_19310 [Ralstonia sp.]|uniref:hypothetical protein n=1 Tax=Ralstonia TaxID=48736 RepID=UPI0010F4C027|nr:MULTISPECIES: hypothetical protein [Ralstonia]MBT2179896.1 hypothetical protein [Ralstonia pickettii]MCL6470447.1 hypothetical protein [Ralstonia sp.]MDH6643579.1 hypothetical protein [Ralstonia sp. GP73]